MRRRLRCFNPTLVRLKRDRTQNRCSSPASFNPTLVRLKQCAAQAVCSRLRQGFNPTLVRLKLDPKDLVANPLNVSIPLWFD